MESSEFSRNSLPNDLRAKPVRRGYQSPAVIYEAKLEVRAGSPLGISDPGDLSDPLNLFGSGK